MRKLLRGIAEFRRVRRPEFAETFARLALGQSPDALFIACSDSRVAPNVFASTDPGDLFVIRNVGNIVPPCRPDGRSAAGGSEGAAIEFAVEGLGVRDIVVCGHSQCGAMLALHGDAGLETRPNLSDWLEHARPALDRLRAGMAPKGEHPPHDRLSQVSALLQLEHLRTYPAVRTAIARGALRLHAWWFDIARADVLTYSDGEGRFVLLNEERVDELVQGSAS